ncbi:ion transporter [Agromyces sp. S2-1-8]|uniref:ion transporter n=1 Tax=Agromyces sp. S2-1-8 TaxID=2897180 RepID=UPI001E4EF05F|nr:ion transporter [Agromyces sp. S2-1-8]MCD5347603.1 ion transporter [Agromyces sp. S2-1-8]
MPSSRAKRRIQRQRSELKNTAYEIFIGLLSILSIANLVLMYLFHAEESLQLILSVMNALFSAIFLADFIYRISTAPSASGYFFRGFGWADLLASLPFAELKVLRLFRVLRVIRLLRELGLRTIWGTLIHDRANSTLMTLLLLGVLVLQFGSISILAVEEDAEGANITSASDAIWYTIVTISTVGYGDQYPVTNPGRLIGALIIIVGVGIFGTFTGYLANLFLGPQKAAEAADAALEPETAPADATVDDVAGGAVAAPVDTGTTAAGDADAIVDETEPVAAREAAGAASPAELSARLEALIAQSEETAAELRRLLADAAPGR